MQVPIPTGGIVLQLAETSSLIRLVLAEPKVKLVKAELSVGLGVWLHVSVVSPTVHPTMAIGSSGLFCRTAVAVIFKLACAGAVNPRRFRSGVKKSGEATELSALALL